MQTHLYLGIDVGKYFHQGYLAAADGSEIEAPFRFTNTYEGYQKLLHLLKNHVAESDFPTIQVGMEATGPYWISLYSFLRKLSLSVIVLNPLQVNAYRNQGIRGNKTDRIDAVLIARVIRFGDYNPSAVPNETDTQLRQLTRLRLDLVQSAADLKKKILALYDQIFPEYKQIFDNMFCQASQKLWEEAIIPEAIAAIPTEKLEQILTIASKGKVSPAKASLIKQKAAQSIGSTYGLDAFEVSMKILLDQLKHFEHQIKMLENHIATVYETCPTTLTTIPGVGLVLAATIKAEIGDFERFRQDKNGAEKLVALAGIDPKLKESGNLQGKVKMSKRGSPFLRTAVRQAAFVAVMTSKDPMFKAIYDKQIAKGKHFEVALSHVANKLMHVVYSLLKNNTDYQPKL